MKINGRTLEASPGPGSYLAISRVWKKGDRVELSLPMRLTSEPMPDDATVQALLYGPIVLAGDLGSQGLTEALIDHQQGPETRNAPMRVPALRAQGKQLEDWIKPADSTALTFRISGSDPPIMLSPLSRIWGRFAA